MHYACVQFKDSRCDLSIQFRKKGRLPGSSRSISGLYAVNLECLRLTKEHKLSEKERHPGTAADSISGLYAANHIALQCVMIQTHSYQSTPFRLCLPSASAPLSQTRLLGPKAPLIVARACGRVYDIKSYQMPYRRPEPKSSNSLTVRRPTEDMPAK